MGMRDRRRPLTLWGARLIGGHGQGPQVSERASVTIRDGRITAVAGAAGVAPALVEQARRQGDEAVRTLAAARSAGGGAGDGP